MRQLLVQVPHGQGKTALDIARACDGINLAMLEAEGIDGPRDVVLIHMSNRQVESLLEQLQSLPELRVTLVPQRVMALHLPADEAARLVTNETIQAQLTHEIQVRLSALGFELTPLIAITVLDSPSVSN
jgi:hypothetical protein